MHHDRLKRPVHAAATAAASLSRRRVLGAAGALAVAGGRLARAAGQGPEPGPDVVTLLVAGPAGGRIDGWSEVIARAIGRDLPPGTAIRRQVTGGADGVTGANQFEARVAPDGETLLLLPGDAPMAWLAGDPRARFDSARWIPVMTGLTPGVLMTRVPARALRGGARLRVAAGAGPATIEMPGLLAVDLLGLETVPVYGLGDPLTARAALAAHAVDAVLLTGSDVPRRAAEFAGSDVRPLLSFGFLGETGELIRDPLFPSVPTLSERAHLLRGTTLAGPLFTAWRAAAAAAQIQFALVLPQLTPASRVAVWHRAGADAAASPEMREASASGVRPLAAPGSNIGAVVGAPDAAALLELRRWLAARLDWRPA